LLDCPEVFTECTEACKLVLLIPISPYAMLPWLVNSCFINSNLRYSKVIKLYLSITMNPSKTLKPFLM